MSSINKKWLLFANLLFNLTLSNNLLAVESNEVNGSEITPDPDTKTINGQVKATKKNIKVKSKLEKNKETLEQILEREELLIRVFTEESIYAEEKFIEQLSMDEYSKLEIFAEELFLEQLALQASRVNNYSNELAINSKHEQEHSLNLTAIGLSFSAIYTDDEDAKSQAIEILSQGKNQADKLSKDELQQYSDSSSKLVQQNLELLKLAKLKKATSQLAIETALKSRKTKGEIKQQQKSLEKLIQLKSTASLLAQDKINTEIIKTTETNKATVSSVMTLATEIEHRKTNLNKLAALKKTAADLHANKVTELNTLSIDLELKSNKLEKLSQLKAIETELLSEKLYTNDVIGQQETIDPGVFAIENQGIQKYSSIDKNTLLPSPDELNAYLNEKPISVKSDKQQNYVLVSQNLSTVPTAVKVVTEEKSVSEKIDFGVKIVKNKKERDEAELAEITNEIAPQIESIEFDPDATELLLVDSKMNNKNKVKTTVIAFNKSKNLVYAPLETIKDWDILGPYPDAVDFQGHNLIPLHDMHTINADLNRGDLTLNLSVPTDAFSNQVLLFNQERTIPQATSDLGLYLNYDTLYTKSEDSQALANVLLSPVVFSDFGFLSNRFRYTSLNSDNSSNFARIESYFQKDFPERLTTLRIGDNISSAGDWGRSSAFTGIQYGTNFSTQPEFLTTPLPYLFSETNAPSTVDIYINDRLTRNLNVEPGPFEIRNIPPISGNGQIQFVIRDELGRERVITTDFYANSALLRPGLSQYSINLGVLREDIGRSSANYGTALGVLNYRRGITDSLTLGTRGEFSRDTKNIGLSANYTLGNKGTLQASAALSNNDTANAALWRLGYRYSKDKFNLASTYQNSDADFKFIGSNSSSDLLSQATLSTGYNSNYGSIGFSHVRQKFTSNNRSVNSFSYAKNIKNKYSLGVYASQARDRNSVNDIQFGLSFSTSFANGGSFSSSWSKTGAESRLNNTYQKSSQELLKPSYRFNTTSYSENSTATDIDLSTRTQYFDVDARLNKRDDNLAHQVGMFGSFAVLNGGYWGFTRDISDSFAVIKVADFDNVGVYQENRFIGRTNSRGYILAPDLSAYLENTVRFDPVDVPLDTTFKTDESQIVPYSKSGLLVDFKIERSTSYSFSVVDEKGRLLPLGSNVEITDEHSSIVGYDGLVFVQAPVSVKKLTIGYGNRACEVELPTSVTPNKVTGIIATDKLVCKRK